MLSRYSGESNCERVMITSRFCSQILRFILQTVTQRTRKILETSPKRSRALRFLKRSQFYFLSNAIDWLKPQEICSDSDGAPISSSHSSLPNHIFSVTSFSNLYCEVITQGPPRPIPSLAPVHSQWIAIPTLDFFNEKEALLRFSLFMVLDTLSRKRAASSLVAACTNYVPKKTPHTSLLLHICRNEESDGNVKKLNLSQYVAEFYVTEYPCVLVKKFSLS